MATISITSSNDISSSSNLVNHWDYWRRHEELVVVVEAKTTGRPKRKRRRRRHHHHHHHHRHPCLGLNQLGIHILKQRKKSYGIWKGSLVCQVSVKGDADLPIIAGGMMDSRCGDVAPIHIISTYRRTTTQGRIKRKRKRSCFVT